MKIAVCVKQIPDPATPYDLDPETHFVQRPDDQVLDDTDRYGIEAGLQLAEESEGEVVLISMSPAGSLTCLRVNGFPGYPPVSGLPDLNKTVAGEPC